MDETRAVIANLAWIPIVPVFFRVYGPKTAVLLAAFGGFLFVPRLEDYAAGAYCLNLNKATVTGLGLLLGVLIFDRQTVRRFRPHWLDLPMLVFVVCPLFSSVNTEADDAAFWLTHLVGERLAGWGLGYLVGRLYFGSIEGTQRLARALVIAALVYLPFCLFEVLAGPRWYLALRLYGQAPHQNVVFRLGGWKPYVFLRHGNELATWTALSAVTAAWLWGSRSGLKLGRVPSWLPAPALIGMTLACHGVYAYVTLGVGLVMVALMLLTRARWPIIVVLLLSLSYMGLRLTGRWDGQALVALGGYTGRPDTIAYRLNSENQYLAKIYPTNFLFGYSNHGWGIYDWWNKAHLYIDGWWLYNLATAGLVGLVSFVTAFFLLPCALMLVRLPSPSPRNPKAAPAWGLLIFLTLYLTDTLHNRTYVFPAILMAGGLVSLEINARKAGVAPALKAGWLAPVLAALLLAGCELLGSQPLTPPPSGTSPLLSEVDEPPPPPPRVSIGSRSAN